MQIKDIADANKYPHNADGTPHFTYYDKEHLLSFVWDGELRHPIQVSHGGYGEPVFDLIPITPEGRPVETMMGAWSWLHWYSSVCQRYVSQFIGGREVH